MKLVCLIFIGLLAGTLAGPIRDFAAKEWNAFKALHKKVYRNFAEDMLRMKIFLQNKLSIVTQNLKHNTGFSSFRVKMNKFGDLMQQEFKLVSNGFKLAMGHLASKNAGMYKSTRRPLPASVDNRQKNLVVPPRAQLKCGSCWSFSSTGAIEGQLAKKTGKLIPLSQQNLVDCVGENNACSGGAMDFSFIHVMKKGIASEASYPYEAKKGPCRANPRNIVTKVTGFQDIETGREADLQDAIAFAGPVSVAIDASSPLLTFYESGIFDPPSCSSTALNHGVLAVGYGQEGGKEYYIIKNSWGPDWGEQGYLKLRKNGNLCGIATMASFPTL